MRKSKKEARDASKTKAGKASNTNRHRNEYRL